MLNITPQFRAIHLTQAEGMINGHYQPQFSRVRDNGIGLHYSVRKTSCTRSADHLDFEILDG